MARALGGLPSRAGPLSSPRAPLEHSEVKPNKASLAMETRTVADIVREVTDISDDQLRQALDVQKETREPLAQILVNMGLISEKEKVRILGRQ